MPCLGMYKRRHKEPEDLEFYLDFEETETSILFFAVDKEGDRIGGGRLFHFSKSTGYLYLDPGVNPKLGFDLTEYGELKVE